MVLGPGCACDLPLHGSLALYLSNLVLQLLSFSWMPLENGKGRKPQESEDREVEPIDILNKEVGLKKGKNKTKHWKQKELSYVIMIAENFSILFLSSALSHCQELCCWQVLPLPQMCYLAS